MFERFRSALKALTATYGEYGILLNQTDNLSELTQYSDNIVDSKLLTYYRNSLYVFVAMDKIANIISAVDFDLYRMINLKGEAEKVPNHPFLDLLYNPNPHQTKNEFMRIFAINLKLSGETFIQLAWNETKTELQGMVNIRPDIVDIEYKEKDGVYQPMYIVYAGAERLEYDETEIVHIKFPDPENPMRGAGVLRPAYNRLQSEKRAQELQTNTFANAGRPDGILSVQGLHSQIEADRLKKKMQATFSGRNAENRIAVITNDMKYQQVSMNAKDMDFMESLKFIRDDILAAMGVPKELVTMEDAGALTNGGDRGYRLFMKMTIEPMMRQFTEAMNERILTPYFEDNLYLKHEELVPEDRKMALEEITHGIDKWITINEARKRMGLEPVANGDSLYRPLGTIDITQNRIVIENAFHGRPYLRKKLEAKAKIEKLAHHATKKEFLTIPSPEYKRVYMKTMNGVTDQNISYMERETKKYFKEQKARVKANIDSLDEKEPITVDRIFDLQKEAEITKRLGMQTFPQMAVRSGNAGLTPVKVFYKVDDFTIDTQLIKLIEERATFFATNVAGVTYDTIASLIADDLAEGIGRDARARKIMDMFDDMTRTRAKRISQTEGTYISSLGLNHAFMKEEVVTGKQWLSSKDGRVRDEHIANDNVVVDKDAAFPNGELYPGHKTINCRCTIAPVVR